MSFLDHERNAQRCRDQELSVALTGAVCMAAAAQFGLTAKVVWRRVRKGARASDYNTLDRMAWRARCHAMASDMTMVTFRGQEFFRRAAQPWARQRALGGGRHYPIAGPVGRLP